MFARAIYDCGVQMEIRTTLTMDEVKAIYENDTIDVMEFPDVSDAGNDTYLYIRRSGIVAFIILTKVESAVITSSKLRTR